MELKDLIQSNTRLTRRVISLESNLDIADENYRTLQKENETIKDELEILKDRVKYNHNDMAGLTLDMIELEKDVKFLKEMKLVKDTAFWKFW